MKAITKGHITIVNFWATWCAPCIEELPSLTKFQANNPDILTMPISLDMQKSVEDLAVFFAKDELKELRWFMTIREICGNSFHCLFIPQLMC